MKIRVLLSDDHPIMREALRSLLEKDPGIAVVGEAEDGRSAVELASPKLPLEAPPLAGGEDSGVQRALVSWTRVFP